MRTKLFLSYSKGDPRWRDLFVRHLKTNLVVGEDLWVDLSSLEGGDSWIDQITQAAQESRCALLLVTPNYLEKGRFARDELALLAAQHTAGLKLLPVLVEPCAWEDEPTLARLQFVRWRNAAIQIAVVGGEREMLRSLREAGDDSQIDRAVIEVCEQARKELGVVAQTTTEQRDDLFEMTKRTLAGSSVQLDEAVHSGDFCVVYRGQWKSAAVAVKAVPDAARLNRVRALFDNTLKKLEHLRDPAFIRVHFHVVDREPHCVVMEYVEWPTLEERLANHPSRKLPPPIVGRILSILARAQGDAHRSDVQIGPLSPANIHVNDDWDIRVSPVRIEGQLARASGLTSGQVMNWDMLTLLSPEICDGLSPTGEEEMDRHEQYYLGMLGLELLSGRRPFEVRRFDDFKVKSSFFENPRGFFEYDAPKGEGWTNSHPAMACVLAQLLARDPAHRFPSAELASDELDAIANGVLPGSVRRRLEDDLEGVVDQEFSARFYDRLFQMRPLLATRFTSPHDQPMNLVEAIQDLVAFRPDETRSRFMNIAKKHARYRLTTDEIDAFQHAFVEEITATPRGRISGDAWNAALQVGLAVMREYARPMSVPSDGEPHVIADPNST